MKRIIPIWLIMMVFMTVFADNTKTELPEDSILNNHYFEMEDPVAFLTEDAYYNIISHNTLDGVTAESVHILCYYRERQKYLCNYKDYSLIERMKEKCKIDSIYQDSIFALIIPFNPKISSPLLYHAFRMAKYISIDSLQNLSLMNYAVDIARRKTVNPCLYFAKEEMDTLRSIMSKKQLEAVINEKNNPEAIIRANRAWDYLSKAGEVDSSDSIVHISKAFSFYRKEMYINDYYVGEHDLIENNLSDLYMHKPLIITMYEGALQKEIIQKKHQKKVGVEFSW